jgi:hypothetical protein
VAVSRLMQDLLGPRAEPWRDLDSEPRHGDTVTLVWQPIESPVANPIESPIDGGVDFAKAPAPAGTGPATASMEVSASVAIHFASRPEVRFPEPPPSGVASAEPGAARATTSPEPPATLPRPITARAVLVGAGLVAIAVAIWRIAPVLHAQRHAIPAPAIAGVDPTGTRSAAAAAVIEANRGTQLDVPVVDPGSGQSHRPLGDPDNEREASRAVPRSATAPPGVAPAEPTSPSPDRATEVAESPDRPPGTKHSSAVNAASHAPGPGAPAWSGRGKPSIESMRRSFEAKDYAGVVAACRAATVTSAIAELCTRSACQQRDMANARRWLPLNPARLIDKLVADCPALGNKVLRTPTLDCSNDPLDCR